MEGALQSFSMVPRRVKSAPPSQQRLMAVRVAKVPPIGLLVRGRVKEEWGSCDTRGSNAPGNEKIRRLGF